jgi:hypothetical protein
MIGTEFAAVYAAKAALPKLSSKKLQDRTINGRLPE